MSNIWIGFSRPFLFMPSCRQCGKMKNLLSPKINSSNQLFSKNITFTKFLTKLCESKFPLYSHCGPRLALIKNLVKLASND